MRLLVAFAFVMFASGCFAASGSLHSGGMTYEASGLNAPSPMEMAASDLTSAQADRVRAEARAMEAHPELFVGPRYGGYGGGYYGGYGHSGSYHGSNYYGYGQYGYGPQTRDSALEELEEDADEFEHRLDALEGRQP